MHERMGLEPLLDLQFRLGEGTGAALAMELLDNLGQMRILDLFIIEFFDSFCPVVTTNDRGI